MGGKFSIIYGDEFLEYNFGEKHPLQQFRVRLALDLMREVGVTVADGISVDSPCKSTIDDLILFHTPEYVEFVRSACLNGTGYLDGGDTPAANGCFEAAQNVVGTSMQAAKDVWEGALDHAYNLGGGLHHAHPDRASGFCVFNDIAVAIAYLLNKAGVERIAYIDIDAHHGDGVMYGYYDDPRVLHIDFHEDGRHLFPGSGRVDELGQGAAQNLKVNVPLAPHSTDRSFVYAFRQLVPSLIRRFAPQVIFMQTGVDAHRSDPLTHLNLSYSSYIEAMKIIHDLAHETCGGKLVMFGGGGYNQAAVAVLWTLMAATVAGLAVGTKQSEAWRSALAEVTEAPSRGGFDDKAAEERAFEKVRETVGWLRERLEL